MFVASAAGNVIAQAASVVFSRMEHHFAWMNWCVAAVVVAVWAPGGWLDRRACAARAAAATAATSPVRVSSLLGLSTEGPSATRSLCVAAYAVYVAHGMSALVTRTPVFGPNPRTGLEFVPPTAVLLSVGLFGVAAWRRLMRGRIGVTLPAGAVRRGDAVTVCVGVSDGAPEVRRVVVRLRAFRETPRGPLGWLRTVEPLWVGRCATEPCGPGREVRTTFVVPADVADGAPRRGEVVWDVLVTGTVGASALEARFRVPTR